MPHFTHLGTLSSERFSARLVGCDGADGRPCDEGVDRHHVWFALRGRFALRRRAGHHVADPSAALLLAPGDPFCIRHPEGCGDVCLAVEGAVVDQLAGRAALMRTPDAAFVRLRGLARALAASRAVEPLALEEAVVEALDGDLRRPSGSGTRAAALAEAVDHELALRFDERLSLTALAAPHAVSVFALCRAFRSVHGESVHRRRQRFRVRHALAEILDSDRSLADIAAECGFASHAHLTLLFRRELGLAPREARGLSASALASRLARRPRGRSAD